MVANIILLLQRFNLVARIIAGGSFCKMMYTRRKHRLCTSDNDM